MPYLILNYKMPSTEKCTLRGNKRNEEMYMIDSSLLALLACPQCHGPLNREESAAWKESGDRPDQPNQLARPSLPDSALICPACRLAFPIENGLPILLIDRAIPIASVHSSGSASADTSHDFSGGTCGDTSTDSFGTPNHLKQE